MRRLSFFALTSLILLSCSNQSPVQKDPPETKEGQVKGTLPPKIDAPPGPEPKPLPGEILPQPEPIALPGKILPKLDPLPENKAPKILDPVAQAKDPSPDPKEVDPPKIDLEPGELRFGKSDKEIKEAALQANYETALAEALSLLGDRKLDKALEALETAKTFKDTEFIRNEIAKLRLRLDQEAAARKTIQDIESILEKGQAAEAAQLINTAFKEFGDTDAAAKLAQLKLQADALLSAQKAEDADIRFNRFRAEAAAALKEKNYRAAALALEQALTAKDDAPLRKQLDDLRAALDRYDELRQKAAELRRDPNNLEEALATLQDAAKTWNTVQVRQEIDEYALALQKRRDRVSVADFEVRGEVGLPEAGRTVAEEILPHLKARFDLVERGQIAKVLDELKLDGVPVELDQQREVGRVAKVRYLVLGSVSGLGGITVNARLVDVHTGLIVQTAKITAPNADELLALLPELGKQLLMSDEEKIVHDRERAKLVKVQAPPPPEAPLPPAPEVPAPDQPAPPPVVIDYPQPPDPGGLKLEDFERLPPPPEGKPIPVPVAGGEAELVVQRRLLGLSLHLGDNLFRRGRYREAHRHFELALHLAPGHVDVRLRLERVRPLLPPPVVVVVEQPVLVVKPRVAILPFVVIGRPHVVPPYLSTWTPGHLAPYFHAAYDVVDPGEVYWYMAHLGMSLRDLMENPYARRWLGRAMHVRYFVFGTVEETASFFVTTHLVDSEYGFRQGSGRIHVRNHHELRLRLGELAGLTLMDPLVRARYLAEQQRFDTLLLQAQQRCDNREFGFAIKIYHDALGLRPNHVEVLARLNFCRQRSQELAWEAARAREFALRQAQAAELQRRQWELAQAAEAIRIQVGPRVVIQAEQQRLAAQATLVREARFYLKVGNFQIGIRRFESAVALAPANDVLVRELAIARAEAERDALAQAGRANALREAALRQQREGELVRARKALEVEQARRLAAEQAARKAQLDRDRVAYQAAFDEGRRLMSAGNYEGAVAALSAAARVRRTSEVEALLNQALVENARASAAARGEPARLALERQLVAEKARREKAEADAKRNQDLYLDALKLAHKALAEQNYPVARARYEEAGKVFRTDAVLTGLKQVETGQAQAIAQADAAKKKALDEQQKTERVKNFLAEGQKAFAARQFEASVKALRQAKKLAPDNADVLTALAKAEQAQEKTSAEARRFNEEKTRQENFRRLLDSGKANLAGKQYDAAKLALTQALILNPGDPAATALLREVDQGLKNLARDAKAQEEAQKKAAVFQKFMNDGRLALSAKRFDDAITAFNAAQKVLPGEQSSADFMREAQKGKSAASAAVAAATRKRAEELKRAADVKKAIDDGRTALTAKNLEAASKSFKIAAALAPQDPAVVRALADLGQAQKLAQAEAETQHKRQTQYQALLTAGKLALAAKKYEDAVKAFAEAGALVPADKTGQDLLRQAQRAQEDARLAAEKTVQAKLDQERAAQVHKLVAAGRDALKAKKLDDAGKAFAEAARLAPKNPEVLRALQDFDFARRQALDQEKARQLYQQAIQTGQKALAVKKYDEAVRAFNDAAKLFPGDRTAQDFLTQAQKAWTAAKLVQAGEQKRLTDFTKFMKSGQDALALKKYADAQRAYADALKLFPTDAAALRGQREAQLALDAVRVQEQKKLTDFTLLMKAGQNAMVLKKYAEAQRAYNDALKLFPTDTGALRGQREATQALDAGRATEKQRQADFSRLMQLAQTAMQAKRFADAQRSYSEAFKLFPADANAQRGLQDANRALDALRVDEQKRLADFNRLVKQGQDAFKVQNYADAKRAYADALKIFPKDFNAQRGLQDASRALDAPKLKTPPKDDPQARYQKEMDRGAALEKQQKFDEAMKAYGEALKVRPKDAKASQALRGAEFNFHLAEGQKHLQARRWLEAQREFEAALRFQPGNPTATRLLNQAKQKKN